jgi:hypothetical protein
VKTITLSIRRFLKPSGGQKIVILTARCRQGKGIIHTHFNTFKLKE